MCKKRSTILMNWTGTIKQRNYHDQGLASSLIVQVLPIWVGHLKTY
jgi:hypothetical protein